MTERSKWGRGSLSVCPEPGGQRSARRSGWGSGDVPPPGRGSAQHPSPVRPRRPPLPAGAAGWKRLRRGAWEVCGNFSIPEPLGRRGAQVGARSLKAAALRVSRLRRLERGRCWRDCAFGVGLEAEGRAAFLAKAGTSQVQPRGPHRISLLRSGPECGGLLRELPCQGSRGGGTGVWETVTKGTKQVGGRSGECHVRTGETQ